MTTTDEPIELTEADREAMLRRYAEERDKRIRPDGNEQYRELEELYGELPTDPWTPRAEREPRTDEVDVALIGAGFAGLLAGARLRQAGVERLCLIDKGADVGGTWYWNRYPGAMCDTAAMIYLPLLEEVGTVPSAKYVPAPEIFAHSRAIAEHFDLYDGAALATAVTSLDWDAESARWIVSTDRGDRIRARHVTIGAGPLHKPKLPGILGMADFAGHTFHTSRWDYEYTGGDPAGAPLTGLADKRVGIIGTGATAVQCIPHLGASAGELFVFQRTPSSIDERNNHEIDPDWFDQLGEGWQQRWLENFTILQTGGFADEDLVQDGWTDISQRIRDKALEDPDFDLSPEAMQRAYHASDDEKMTEIRARVDAIIDDPGTAEVLKPWYRQLCKRPCFHDEYLQTFNRPNVHLVDTDGRGVERITERGVVVGGEEIELDCIVYASGFEVGTDYARRCGFDVRGRDGRLLSEHWAEGMRSLHGIHVHGFPNLYLLGPSQGANLISNIPHNLVESGRTVAEVVAHAAVNDADTVEVTAEAETAWVARLEAGGRTFGGDPTCTPGYYNNEGHGRDQRNLLNALGYPEGPVAYFQYLDQWRRSGDFEGLTFD